MSKLRIAGYVLCAIGLAALVVNNFYSDYVRLFHDADYCEERFEQLLHSLMLLGVAATGLVCILIGRDLEKRRVEARYAPLKEVPDIPGKQAVFDWFGEWPDFHDAEILDLHFDRSGPSRIRIHAWNTGPEIDVEGYLVRSRHAVVTFRFEQVTALNLQGFNTQNVIAGLDLSDTEKGCLLRLYPSYGMAGEIVAEKISVEITPGKPPCASS